jgi:hypothetical protein
MKPTCPKAEEEFPTPASPGCQCTPGAAIFRKTIYIYQLLIEFYRKKIFFY